MTPRTRVTEVLSISEGGLAEPWSGPPPEVPGYRVGALLARGGQAEVYDATRVSDGLGVVVKVMHARAEVSAYSAATFKREVELLATLRHPNVVSLLDHGALGDAFWFVMERCDGGTLYERCAARGALPVEEAARVMTQLVTGLAYVHARGVVHRDVKPENVLFTDEGSRVVLGDFGIAKRFELAGMSGVSAVGTIVGTAAYMPREQWTSARDLRPSADVWSAAATYLYAVTGEPPRRGATGPSASQSAADAAVGPVKVVAPGVPEGVAAVIDRALDDDPERRYRDAIAFRAAWLAANGAR